MNRPGQAQAKPASTQKQEPVIVFIAGGKRMAIPAGAVHEIRSTDSLAGEAATLEHADFPWVRHTVERAGTTHYVVNVGTFFGLPRTRPSQVLVLRGVRCALLIDGIERMDSLSAIYALPRAFQGDERRWYLGLALFEEGAVPMLDPRGLLPSEHLERLDAHNVAALSGVPA